MGDRPSNNSGPSAVTLGLRATSAVALNTAREAIRSKVFSSLAFFAALLVLSSVVLGEMSLHNEARLATDGTLFFSTLFAMAIAVYSSITLFYTEIERRTIYTIISKPIPRWQFLLGKYLGVQILTISVVVALALLSAGVIAYQTGGVPEQLGWAFLSLYLQLCITTALAHLFAAIASPLLAGFVTVACFIAGNLFSQLSLIKTILEKDDSPLSYAIVLVEYVLPNLEALNLSRELTYQLAISPAYVAQAVLYTLSYAGVVMLLAIGAFSRRDLS